MRPSDNLNHRNPNKSKIGPKGWNHRLCSTKESTTCVSVGHLDTKHDTDTCCYVDFCVWYCVCASHIIQPKLSQKAKKR